MEIRKLFAIREREEPSPIAQPDEEQDEQKVRISYYQSGYGAALKATGNSLNFKACLDNVYTSFEQQCREQEIHQKRLKQPYIDEKQRKQSELKNAEAAISIFEEKREHINEQIDSAKHDIEDVKHHPEKYGLTSTKKPQAQFYIGFLLLIPITIYLFVFYISATYSAFFKDFANDSLTAAIFDAQALNNALKAGWLEGVLVLTIPSVFLGLGYVIHMVQKEKGIKNVLRLIALFIVTFLFDALLAYQIEKKIYEFNKTLDSLPYNLQIALGEAEFWMIIFAGFVVYIIWGLVFDITMKEHENMDKINGFVKTKLEELKRLRAAKGEMTEEINNLKRKVVEITGKIEELQTVIDGFIMNLKQYLLYHNQYKEGWFQAIGSELNIASASKTKLLEDCENVSNEHLQKLNLINPDFQHVIYSKVS